MKPTDASLLVTQRLSVGYGPALTLFKDLDLSLAAGELICFMGPNGIGKSTLIRTIAGLHAPLSGDISVRGDKDISVVLTDRVTAGGMTVSELVTFGRYPYLDWNISLSDHDLQIIDHAVRTVGIRHLLHKKVEELSDGQLQMAMIARALAQQTSILLLDEPTAHLDLNNRVNIMNLLRQLARIGRKAVLVSTHELDLALQTADKIWLAMPDKSIKTGIPEDLVLDSSIDEVFQLKGFDLKTGKMEHVSHRGIAVSVHGSGPVFLWTRNALERSGFIVSDHAAFSVSIENNEWKFKDKRFATIGALLSELTSASA